MNHYIIFQTSEGLFLVFVCTDKYANIESELSERAAGFSFETKEDVAEFMDKYVNDVQRPDYHPYWHFEDAIAI